MIADLIDEEMVVIFKVLLEEGMLYYRYVDDKFTQVVSIEIEDDVLCAKTADGDYWALLGQRASDYIVVDSVEISEVLEGL